MTEFEKYKELLIGRTLSNLYYTEQNGPHDFCPGIAPAYYFATIMEVDNKVKYCFWSDCINEWNNEEPLLTVTSKNWVLPKGLVFKGQKIVDLTKDEDEQLTFHLENRTTIRHTQDYGDGLYIENPDFPDDINQYERYEFVAPKSKKPKQTLWQRIYVYLDSLDKSFPWNK
ncbi:MAG: hypothetical protein M0D57_07920 [Sphingobacteriales bacterium JAD_PAG50586_3]|nr:MAG: hypothetical protein M0D57_07920 [Sphingobacteriales bacterium JAD_PAG50586_3]